MALAAAIPSHLLQELQWRQEHAVEFLNTGLNSVDSLLEGCPRGRITEIIGPASSGRTTLLHSILAEATRLGEFCAIVDTNNAFDPASAEAAGIDLRRLVWIRCGGHADHAMKAADLLLHSGGFGVIALDLCDVPAPVIRRIPLSWWYRFRRTIENTPTVFLILENEPSAKACASLLLEMQRDQTRFTGTAPFQYLESATYHAPRVNPSAMASLGFEAHALR